MAYRCQEGVAIVDLNTEFINIIRPPKQYTIATLEDRICTDFGFIRIKNESFLIICYD